MSDISQVVNFLATADENFTDNLSASIASGAATVLVNSAAEYPENAIVVLTVDPGTINEATFTGTKIGNSFNNCKWTEGNVAVGHASGAVITDYDSATHYNMLRKAVEGILEQTGAYKTAPLIAAVYPVGSIYTNASVNTNPATLLGFGTSEAFGAGRVPVGVDSTQTEFNTLGKTGGAKTHFHWQTVGADPSVLYLENNGSGSGHTRIKTSVSRTALSGGSSSVNNSRGDGTYDESSLQPYITVFMWRRTT